MKRPRKETVMTLKLDSKWYADGLQLAKWSTSGKKILSKVFPELRNILIRKLGPYCMHLKGRGGIKGSARLLHRKLNEFPYSARVDISSYYGSINHNILFKELQKLNIETSLMSIIKDYVMIPDSDYKGCGIVAGGALSTLLGAVYLSPLDMAMDKLYKKGGIFYLRYVDDIVFLAKSRWRLKAAMKLLYETLNRLKLNIHKHKKYFVGKTSRGFSFLGYFFKPNHKLKPSNEALHRLVQRSRQLIEQGADKNRLLSYFEKWLSYFHGSLHLIVCFKTTIELVEISLLLIHKKPRS